MTFENTDPGSGRYGAKRQSWKKGNPRDLLKRIVDETKGERAAYEAFVDATRDDPDMAEAMREYWFTNNYRSLIDPPRKAPKPEEKEALAAKVSEWEEQAVRQIKLGILDMMVDGKPLRDHTFGEVGKLGGKFTALSKGGKPNEKVGKLSETAVRKLFR